MGDASAYAVMPWRRALTMAAFVALLPVSFLFARGVLDFSVASAAGVTTGVVAGVVGLALWTQAKGRKELMGDVGTGLLVGLLVTAITIATQAGLDRRAEDRAARQTLLLSVTLQRDLVGIDLHGRDLSGAFLRRKDLRGAQLQHGTFRGTDFSRSRLSGTDTSLEGSDLRGARFVRADLRHATLHDARAKGADFTDARADDADVSSPHFGAVIFEGASLRNVFANGSLLTGTNFGHADLRDGEFVEAHLEDSHFEGADLRRADLTGAHLAGASLREADLRDAYLDGADLRYARHLPRADLRGARYSRLTRWPSAFDPKRHGARRDE